MKTGQEETRLERHRNREDNIKMDLIDTKRKIVKRIIFFIINVIEYDKDIWVL
jgi:hypothetical protein